MVNFYMNRGTDEDDDDDELDEVERGMYTDARRRTLTQLLDLVGEMTGILLVAAHPERGEGAAAFKLAHETMTTMNEQLRTVLGTSSPEIVSDSESSA
jgi:hypothetical protein